jgi:hypothetical protein
MSRATVAPGGDFGDEPEGRTPEIHLERGFFGPKEWTIVRFGDLCADLFRYATGVERPFAL